MSLFVLKDCELSSEVDVPGYLRQVMDDIIAEAGDAAVVLVYGGSRFQRTDLSVAAPATIELALEDVAIVVVPINTGCITMACSGGGRSKSVTHEFDGQVLHLTASQ